MVAVNDLRDDGYKKSLRATLNYRNSSDTRAAGTKVFSESEGLWFKGSDGVTRRIDGDFAAMVRSTLDDNDTIIGTHEESLRQTEVELEASRESLALAQEEIEAGKVTLEETRERLAAEQLRLDQTKLDLAATDAELAAESAEAALLFAEMETSLSDNATALGKLATDMSAVDKRAGDARVVADRAEKNLAATDKTLAEAVTRQGALDTKLTKATLDIGKLNTDMTDVTAKAGAANTAAGEAKTALAAAEKRIATAEGSLTTLDGKMTTAARDLGALTTNLAEVRTTAGDAKTAAANATTRLTTAEGKLSTAEQNISGLSTRAGSIETAVTASDRKAQEAYNTATAASNSAGTAATAAEAARRDVEVLLASSGSLIIGGDYETEESYQKGFRSFINLAHSGSYALGLPTDSYNYVEHPQVGAQPGALLRGSFFIKKAANADNIGNADPDIIIRAIKRDGSHVYVYPNVKNTPGPLTSAWIEWTFEFPALPENTRFVAPWVRNGYSPVSGGKEKVYIDQATLADTTSYQSAVEEAKAAKAEAVAAAAKAQDAMTAANLATRTADGKSTTTFSMNSPSGMGVAVGDKHFKMSSLGDGGAIVGQWRWNGNVWVSEKVDGSQIANFDAGYITSGFLDVANRIRAGSILADKVMIGTGGNLFPDPTLTNPAMHTGWTSAQIGAAGTGDSPANGSILIASGTTQRGRYFGLQATEEHARVRVTPGSYYHVSVKARTATTSVQNGVAIFVRLYKAGTNDWVFPAEGSNIFLEAGKNTASDAWETISGTFRVTEGYDRVAIGFYNQAAYTGSTRFCAPSVEPAADGDLIVDGAITGTKVNAQSVAAAVGQFVKVQASNVEVTDTLTARIVEAMSVASKNLIVTGDASLTGKTYIENLAVNVVKAQKISTDQLIAGTATFDTAVSRKMFVESFTASNIETMNATVAGTLSAKVVDAMDVRSRNLIVTGNANLTGDTYIKNLAATEIKATSISTNQLLAGTATFSEALATKLFAETFTAKNIETMNATVAGVLSFQVARGMSVEARNLVVTGDSTLSGKTYIENLAANVVKAASVSTDQLVAGNANLGTATADKLFAGIFASRKITSQELYVGSPSNLIPGGWGGKTTLPGWEAFGLNTTVAHNTGQVADSSYWVEGRFTRRADVPFNVEAGREYHFSVWARANVTNSRFYVQMNTNGSSPNTYMVSNQIVPNGSWKEYTYVWTPADGTDKVNSISVYANHPNGSVTTGTQWFGGMTLTARTDGVLIKDGTVKANHIEVTGTLAASVAKAIDLSSETLSVTKKAWMTDLEVTNDLLVKRINATEEIQAPAAKITGKLEASQINVTEKLSAELVSAMSIETKELVVTEGALRARSGVISQLIADKMATQELTVTGTFRSGGVNMPGVVIPQSYTTDSGRPQLGVWLSPNGTAPSLGGEYGQIAGIWLDQGVRAGMSRVAPLHIRGQGGAGVWVWGDLQVESGLYTSTPGKDITLWPGFDGSGTTIKQKALKIRSDGIDAINFNGVMNFTSQDAAEYNAVGALTLRGAAGLVIQSNGNIALRRTNGNTYLQSWTGGGLKTLYLGSTSGAVYTDSSSIRYKTNVETMEPDHAWLDQRTVWYDSKAAVEAAERVAQREAIGDLTPMSAEEFELIESLKRRTPGRIAEESVESSPSQVVYGADGTTIESYDYTRDGTMLIPHVREHRDKIAELEAKIERLERFLDQQN